MNIILSFLLYVTIAYSKDVNKADFSVGNHNSDCGPFGINCIINGHKVSAAKPNLNDHKDACVCSQDFAPLCCDEKNDFNNECLAKCMGEDLKKCIKGTCASIGCGCKENIDPYCCDGITFDNSCVAACNGKKYPDKCQPWECDEQSKKIGEKQANSPFSAYSPEGIFAMTSSEGTSEMNLIIVMIQLCILGACCMTFGISVSFCFENESHTKQSFEKE